MTYRRDETYSGPVQDHWWLIERLAATHPTRLVIDDAKNAVRIEVQWTRQEDQ